MSEFLRFGFVVVAVLGLLLAMGVSPVAARDAKARAPVSTTVRFLSGR